MAIKMTHLGSTVLAVLIVVGLSHSATSTTYLVGESGSNGGWTFVSGTQTSYDDQFKNIYLVVGDILSFVFTVDAHNLVEVPPTDVASCSTDNAIQTYTESVNVTLESAGDQGFICGFPNHCSQYGMYLSVTVHEASASAPESGTPAPAPAPEFEPAPAPAPEFQSAPAPESGA